MSDMALKVHKPSSDVWLLRGGRGESNCYYLPSERVLIDAGLRKTGREIVEFLERERAALDWLVLTHADVDHVGGASVVAQATGASVACHKDEAPYVRLGRPRPFSRSPRGRVLAVLAEAQVRLFKPTDRITVSRELVEGDQVNGMRTMHLPGHSPGSMGLYRPSSGYLFAGDAVLTERKRTVPAKSTSAGSGEDREPLPLAYPTKWFRYDSLLAYRSLERLLRMEISAVFAGHGDPYMDEAEAIRRDLERLLASPY